MNPCTVSVKTLLGEESSAGTTPATPILRSFAACCQIILLAAGFVGFFAAEASAQSTAKLIGIRPGELAEELGDGPNSADGKVDWSQIINMPTGFADGVDATGGGGGGDVDSFAADPSSNGNFSSAAWITDLGLAGLYQPLDSDLTAFAGKTAPSGAVVGTSDSQTLTNKTLTSPIISTISNTGTLTLPTSTDTLVGRATTDTLTNKTLTSPTLTTPNLGTPSAATLTNATGLPISTGVSGLGAGVATMLATPSSANVAAAVTDETGSGLLVFGTSPTLSAPVLNGTPSLGDDAAWRTALNLIIGLDVQAQNTHLTDLADGTLTGSKVSGAVTVSGGTVNNSVIGGTTPAAITGTTITATTSVTTVDAAYNSGTWDGDNTVPTKNAVRDQIQAMLAGGGLGTSDIDSSAEIAAIVGDETGSGALVFGTSPTIASPTLNGTPTIGDAAAWRTALAVQAADTDLDSVAAGITGLVKGAGNGSGYAAATANADYLAVTGGSPTFVDMDASIGTLTASDPFTLSQTWNDGSATFEGLRLDVTTTANGGSSRMFAIYDDGNLISYVNHLGAFYAHYWIGLGGGGGNPHDTLIQRQAAHTIAQANSTAAQAFGVAHTYTSATNNELLRLQWSSNVGQIGTVKGSGGGTARDLALMTDGTNRVLVGATTGHVTPAADSAQNLGGSGAEWAEVHADAVTTGTLNGTTPGATGLSALAATTASELRDAAGASSGVFADAAVSNTLTIDTMSGNAWTALRKKTRTFVLFGPTTDAATGDGKAYYPIPPELNGANITYVHLWAVTAGTTGTSDVQIARVRSGSPVDVLSTKLTIDSTEQGSDTAASAAVINTSNDDVATNDVLRIDVDDVSSVAPKGLIVTIGFELQ